MKMWRRKAVRLSFQFQCLQLPPGSTLAPPRPEYDGDVQRGFETEDGSWLDLEGYEIVYPLNADKEAPKEKWTNCSHFVSHRLLRWGHVLLQPSGEIGETRAHVETDFAVPGHAAHHLLLHHGGHHHLPGAHARQDLRRHARIPPALLAHSLGF